MPEIAIPVETGRIVGSRSSGRLRAAGKIPAVIYGHGVDPIPVAVGARDLRSALSTEAGLNALLSLRVDGTTHLTVAREIQRHPVRHTVVHVDFQIVRRDEVISADVPIALVGEASAVHASDGVVDQQTYTLTIRAFPDRIPTSIEVDISGLEVNGAIRVSDLTLPDGVTTDVDPEHAIVIGQPPQAGAEAAAIEAEAAEAEAEAAAESEAEGAAEPGEAAAESVEAEGGDDSSSEGAS
ncbi:MAG TPA: 50S ribosomal protein L25 [Acidimicrobiales bacterium]|nr:50S ribosomal protein L25 [Acidimicrobiales bacterium]